jgi:hypothetical protein
MAAEMMSMGIMPRELITVDRKSLERDLHGGHRTRALVCPTSFLQIWGVTVIEMKG